MNNQRWDYPMMDSCAKKLETLSSEAAANKRVLDEAFETLTVGMQAEAGKAFKAAYLQHVDTINLFAEALNHEATTIKQNSNTMQEADENIAQEIRRKFMK